MFRIFLRLLAVIGGALLLLALVGWALPREFSVMAERQLAATPAEAFAAVNDLRTWPDWSTWNPKANPYLTLEPGPVHSGEGASQSWTEPRGTGKLWFTAVQPDQQIDYTVRFGNFPDMASRFEFAPLADGVRVPLEQHGPVARRPVLWLPPRDVSLRPRARVH